MSTPGFFFGGMIRQGNKGNVFLFFDRSFYQKISKWGQQIEKKPQDSGSLVAKGLTKLNPSNRMYVRSIDKGFLFDLHKTHEIYHVKCHDMQ